MTEQTHIAPQPGPAAPPAVQVQYHSNPMLVAVLFFAFGFVTALLITQVVAQNAAAAYEQALDDAVTAFVAAMPEQQQQAVVQAAPAEDPQPDPNVPVAVSADDDPYLGPADAPITIIEFSDYRCPYCGRFAQNTLEPLLEQYGDQVRFVYRDFPVLGDASFVAANAAQCVFAQDSDKYWEYHDLLFANQANLGDSATLISLADEIGLDTDAFQTCLTEETYSEEVLADYNTAQNLGATGTPTFFVNGRYISGAQPINVFQAMIDEELAALDSAG